MLLSPSILVHLKLANTYYMLDPTTDMDGTEHSLDYNLSNKGKHAYSITAVSPAIVANAGTATEYSYSSITGYGTGIKYNNVLYAGDGDNVRLLSHSILVHLKPKNCR